MTSSLCTQLLLLTYAMNRAYSTKEELKDGNRLTGECMPRKYEAYSLVKSSRIFESIDKSCEIEVQDAKDKKGTR